MYAQSEFNIPNVQGHLFGRLSSLSQAELAGWTVLLTTGKVSLAGELSLPAAPDLSPGWAVT